MQHVDTIIEHGIVLTQDDRDTVYLDGSLAIEGGRILAVGDADAIANGYEAAQVIDASRKAVLPGFVNTHFHCTQNFMKGTRDDLDLLDWINLVSFPRIKVSIDGYRRREFDIHKLAALHAGIDLLSSGITTTVNMEWGMLPAIQQAYELVGQRVVNVLTFTDVPSWTPRELIIEPNEAFALAAELIATFQGTRTDFAYGVACPNSASGALIERCRTEATRNHARLHIHLAETKYEYERFQKEHQVSPTRYLENLGFWDSDVWAAHCIWLTGEDIDILAKHHVGVAHNPKCNMKLADGPAPIAAMLKSGLAVGLGIDSCAVSDNTDFFEAMRAMVFLQRLTTMDPKAIVGKEALKAATIGGARAMGKGAEIGSLEAGKAADIIVVDLTAVNTRPYNDIENNLVFAANSQNIEKVLIGGQVLVDRGRFTRFDKEEVLDEVEHKAAQIYRNAGIELPPYFAIKDT